MVRDDRLSIAATALRAYRRSQRWSQPNLIAALTGFMPDGTKAPSKPTICAYEIGTRKPSRTVALALETLSKGIVKAMDWDKYPPEGDAREACL